jgi:hypothetical protein
MAYTYHFGYESAHVAIPWDETHPFIHPSAWKGDFPNFALRGF